MTVNISRSIVFRGHPGTTVWNTGNAIGRIVAGLFGSGEALEIQFHNITFAGITVEEF